MKKRNRRISLTVMSIALLATLCGTISCAQAQTGSPQPGQNVTMTLFKIINQKGKKYLQTQTGETVPIDGKRLDKNATMVAIYRDQNSNYWFINKDGQPTSIPPDKVQWAVNLISEQRYEKANTPAPAQSGYFSPYGQAPVQQTTIVEQPGNSGSGSSALGTGLAAAGGAMVGGLIGSSMYDGNHFYGVPYGAPVYRGEGNHPYYMNNGNKVYVNNAHTDPVVHQFNQQGDWEHKDQWGGTHPTTGGSDLGYQHHFEGDGGGSRGGFGHEGWGGFRGRRR